MKQAADAKEQSQYNQTLLDSLTFYINLLNAQASLSSNLKSLERAKANYDLAEKLLNGGKGTKFEVLQADARLAKAQQELISQEAQFRIAEIDLSEHLNINLNSALHIADEEIKTISLIDESVEIEEYIKTAFRNNPDIKAVIKNKEAVSRKSWSTLGAFLPSLDLYLDITGSGFEVSDLFRVTSLGFDLKYDIGQGLGVNAVSKSMASRAELNRAELQYLQELIRIEKELRSSYLNYQASKSLLEATQKEYIASKEAYRLSQLRYKNGIEILANMLDREADLKQSQLNLIKSASDYNLNQVKLVYNMGTINTKQILESGF